MKEHTATLIPSVADILCSHRTVGKAIVEELIVNGRRANSHLDDIIDLVVHLPVFASFFLDPTFRNAAEVCDDFHENDNACR